MDGDIESQDDNSCVFDESLDLPKDGGEIDQKNIVYDDAVDDDENDDLNDKDAFHLNDGLANNNNNNNNNNNSNSDSDNIKLVEVINQSEEQRNHFGATNNILQP